MERPGREWQAGNRDEVAEAELRRRDGQRAVLGARGASRSAP
jgi:hypothetical protein